MANDTADIDNVLEQMDDAADTSLAELYKTVCVNEDIIIVIDAEAEEAVRKGLITIKYKTNKAAKDAGEEVDKRTLEFAVIPWSPREIAEEPANAERVKLQIYLKTRSAVHIHKLIFTDKEF